MFVRWLLPLLVAQFFCYFTFASGLGSTFIGGNNSDFLGAMVVDTQGCVYVAGTTHSADFPTTDGAYDVTLSGDSDIFIAKLTPDLRTVVAATFLGGEGSENYPDIFLDEEGNLYVAGSTNSRDFPVTVAAYDSDFNGGNADLFVTRLDKDLSTVHFSTYIGGSGGEGLGAISSVKDAGIYMVALSNSLDFPITTVAARREYGGGENDLVVFRLSFDLQLLLSSTYLGGTERESFPAIDVDSNGCVFVAGSTASTNYPVTEGTFGETYSGGYYDDFITKLDPELSSILASTFIGGVDAGGDALFTIKVASDDNVLIAGHAPNDFPTTLGAWLPSSNSYNVAYVAELSNDLSTLVASTFIGDGAVEDLFIEKNGDIYVTGWTHGSDFPSTEGSFDQSFNGGTDDVFICQFDRNLSTLKGAAFFGGSDADFGQCLLTDGKHSLFTAGFTASPSLPTASATYDLTFNGGGMDGFIMRVPIGLGSGVRGFSSRTR